MELINLKKVEYQNISLEFKKEHFINSYIENNYYYAYDKELNLICSGRTKEELLNDIYRSIIIQWRMYVECKIEELSKDAIKLRTVFIDSLKKVYHNNI